MKMTVYESDFHSAFIEMGRQNNFSHAGRRALFEYFEHYEEETGEEIELDVVALCCDYTEYESLDDFAEQYGDIWAERLADLKEEHGDDEDTIREDFLDELNQHTTVINVDGEGFITACF